MKRKCQELNSPKLYDVFSSLTKKKCMNNRFWSNLSHVHVMMLVCLLNFITEKSLTRRRTCCQSKWTGSCGNKNREFKEPESQKLCPIICSLSSDLVLQFVSVSNATKSRKTAKCDEDRCQILDEAFGNLQFFKKYRQSSCKILQ